MDTGGGKALHDKHTRNPRTVWTISAEPTSVAHFATFPTELVRRCLQAGTSDGGCCPECLMPWAPVVETEQLKRERPRDRTAWHEAADAGHGTGARQASCGNTVAGVDTRILGYRPTCSCGEPESVPCTVLDPFAGIGRTLQTAKWMKRRAIGIELNPEYAAMVEATVNERPKWKKVPGLKPPKSLPGQMFLFE